MNKKLRQSKERVQGLQERGQVLIVGIIMVLILLLSIFIFFDISNVIRAKMKVETAEQSAAIAAASWQGKSLNLIGELNLLVACQIMLTDSEINSPISATEYAKARAKVNAINELQSRVSFLGPLVALTAAQQAAKNNGISQKTGSASAKYDFDLYVTSLETSPKYLAFNQVNGFKWKIPYRTTIENLTNYGIVIRPNARVAGIENVDPSYLADESLYTAIKYANMGFKTWCHSNLRMLIKKDDSYFEGNSWYSPSFDYINFNEQSEIYSLDVHRNSNIDNSNYDALLDLVNRDITRIPEYATGDLIDQTVCKFYQYNNNYFQNHSSYTGPYNGADTPWQRGYFLRGNLKNEFVFGGAVAYAEAYQDIPAITSFRDKKMQSDKIEELVEKSSTNDTRVGSNYGDSHMNKAGSVAKAYSSLYNPTVIPIVTPAFNEVSLIPSTMNKIRPFSMTWPIIETFIDWLKDIDDIYDEGIGSPPAGTEFALEALNILGQSTFRKQGYNHNFTSLENIPKLDLFKDDYKYPNDPNGAGWLQQATVRYDNNPPPKAIEGVLYYYDKEEVDRLNEELEEGEVKYIYPYKDDVWIYNGNHYLVIHNGKIMDYENDPEDGCAASYIHNGGGIHTGTNTGPGEL